MGRVESRCAWDALLDSRCCKQRFTLSRKFMVWLTVASLANSRLIFPMRAAAFSPTYAIDMTQQLSPRSFRSSRSSRKGINEDSGTFDNVENDNVDIGVLQIYPLECYGDLIREQRQQQIQASSSTTTTNDTQDTNSVIRSIQQIYMIRHAEGTHNVQKQYKSPENRDARLTAKGRDQCTELASRTCQIDSLSKNNPSLLVVTSPMTRCIQTTLLSFPHLRLNDMNHEQERDNEHSTPSKAPTKLVAHEGIRETVNYECDVRRSLVELKHEFPSVDLSSKTIPDATLVDDNGSSRDVDPIWHAYRQRLGDTHDGHCESAELYVVAKRAREFFSWLVRQEDQGNEEEKHKVVVICTHSAFLRCALNWGQPGGVPMQVPQVLDARNENEKLSPPRLFEYCYCDCGDDRDGDISFIRREEFEATMRSDYENCEMRSFCLVQRCKPGITSPVTLGS